MTKLRKSGFLVALFATAALTLSGCASTRSTETQFDDAAITTAVKAKLAADPEVKAHEIDVDTVDGTVTLSGNVDNNDVRSEAIQLARGTDGVVAVTDNMSIKSEASLGTKIDDTTITTKVKAKLALEDGVKARNIDVDTLEGVVTLTGQVKSWGERSRAQQIAQETDGVKGVKNNLEVVSGG
jgi:hyperosmotically inducible protein